MKHPWKKKFLKIPAKIAVDIENCESDFMIAVATKKITADEILAGHYMHIGLAIIDEELSIIDSQIPNSVNGSYSNKNVNGWESIRKDLPKISKTYYWESPNFGDASRYGTHAHSHTREVYQREYHEPRMHKLLIELIKSPAGDQGTYFIKFQIDEIFDRRRADNEERLFFALNLLQENTGVSAVYKSDISNEEFQRLTLLDWEIFPEGTADLVMESISRRAKPPSADNQARMRARIEMFNAMKSKDIILGSGGFGSYIGAIFADDLAVFENVNYGNALYILYEDWETTSQKSRLDLLSGTDTRFYRVVHTEGWEDRFKQQMKDELKSRGISISGQRRFF